MKIYIFFILAVLSRLCISQNRNALEYYNEAVNFYNEQNYEKAEDLFTKSLALMKSSDVYFARALCRGKMANKNGYCEDLVKTGIDGSEEARKLFTKSCGKIDTSYTKLDQQFTKTTILSRVITYSISGGAKFEFKQKYATQQIDSLEVHSVPATQVFTVVEVAAEFPGGLIPMRDFMRDNMQTPEAMLKFESSKKAFVKFTVFEDGTLHDITVLQGAEGCPECDIEATRIVAIMPRWKPAQMNGHPVKCYFNLVVTFSLNR